MIISSLLFPLLYLSGTIFDVGSSEFIFFSYLSSVVSFFVILFAFWKLSFNLSSNFSNNVFPATVILIFESVVLLSFFLSLTPCFFFLFHGCHTVSHSSEYMNRFKAFFSDHPPSLTICLVSLCAFHFLLVLFVFTSVFHIGCFPQIHGDPLVFIHTYQGGPEGLLGFWGLGSLSAGGSQYEVIGWD